MATSKISRLGCNRSVAEMAAERKILKYSTLPANIIFQPMAFETLGPINQSGVEFISEIGRRLKQVSGDARERFFLFLLLSSDLTLGLLEAVSP
jgi:hypothetical protein